MEEWFVYDLLLFLKRRKHETKIVKLCIKLCQIQKHVHVYDSVVYKH